MSITRVPFAAMYPRVPTNHILYTSSYLLSLRHYNVLWCVARAGYSGVTRGEKACVNAPADMRIHYRHSGSCDDILQCTVPGGVNGDRECRARGLIYVSRCDESLGRDAKRYLPAGSTARRRKKEYRAEEKGCTCDRCTMQFW